ncbi:conserved exported hypothetical protein [Erythrobacter sp. EC-HK427]|nr:conserved exported hypothetical protein [Erythrobacter sp. EC-HK427]
MRNCSKALLAAALLCGAMPVMAQEREQSSVPQLAVMGTIPLVWGEAAGIEDILSGAAEPHWARSLIEQRAQLAPLDYLSADALAPHTMLLLAQPRGLTGEENVALDSWVRAGGRLLLFADPMMTGESRFGLGDRRRPQDTVLLSPILNHWGLQLRFDDSQAEGVRHSGFDGTQVPVNLAGEFAATGDGCTLEHHAVIARCTLGEGEVLAIADSAMLDFHGPIEGAPEALFALAAAIFPGFGDSAGNGPPIPHFVGESQSDTDGVSPSTMDEVTITGGIPPP